MESIWGRNTYWIADICGGDDARVKEYCEKFDDCVEIEEHQDLLAAWLVAKALSESKREVGRENTDQRQCICSECGRS